MSDAKKARRELIRIRVNEISPVDRPAIEESFVLIKALSGSTTLPLADDVTEWDSTAAQGRILEAFTKDGETDWGKVHSAAFWYDVDNAEKMSGHKLFFADIVDGTLKAIPRGVIAVAAVLQGARGGVDIPESDIDGVRAKVATYYKRMELGEPPWEKKATDADSVGKSEGNMRTKEEQAKVAKVIVEKSLALHKAAGEKTTLHAALFGEKLALAMAGIEEIAARAGEMETDELRDKIRGVSNLLWSAEDLAGVIGLTKKVHKSLEEGDEATAFDVLSEGVKNMLAELEKAKKAEGEEDPEEKAKKAKKPDGEETDPEAEDEEKTKKAKKPEEDSEEDDPEKKAKKPEDDTPPDGEETDPEKKKDTYKRRLTKARIEKLTSAFTALSEILKELGADNLSDLSTMTKSVEGVEGTEAVIKVVKSLVGPGETEIQKRANETDALKAEVEVLKKKVGDLEQLGVTKSLGGDGVPVKKSEGSMWKGVV